jgi:FtsH-binding integral membrane protein
MSSSNRLGARVGSIIDQGLRAHMQRVYMYMAFGLMLTGGVAYYIASQPRIFIAITQSGMYWLFFIAMLAIPLTIGMGIQKLSAQTAQILFWLYAAIMGVSMAFVLLAYTGESVARIFLITSGTFGGMSLYGYTTSKDLTSWGSFLFMGLWGVILAAVVNLFLQSSGLQFALSVMSVVVFTGLTAYDTQLICRMYTNSLSAEEKSKQAILGALKLYLDFINMFWALLRLFGDRR